MSLSLLSHAAHLLGSGVPVSTALNSLALTLVGLSATLLWSGDIS